MASIYARGGKLWARVKGVKEPGKWGRVATGYSVGDEKKAARFAAEAQKRIDERRVAGGSATGPLTVAAWAREWIPDRRALDLDWRNDQSRLKHHVLPVIGHMVLREVRTIHIVDLFRRIRTKPRPGRTEVVSQRTVYNIYSVVCAMFRDAKLSDRIDQSPCELDERQLGPIVDKDPEWRAGAVFTRDEAEAILSSSVIPADRQMTYGFELLGGLRPGEVACLRWRHYNSELKPLGKLLVARAYNTRKHREKSTKTDATRHVPVHPTLAAMLAEWKLGGWPAMMGRPPEPDDLIVPLPPADAERRRSREGEAFRGHDYAGKRWRNDDLPALGWRHRQHYDMKATFITLALDDGAAENVIRDRVTHTKKTKSAFDGYDRGSGRQWAETCAEVVKLQLTRRAPPRGVVGLPIDKPAKSEECGAFHGTGFGTAATHLDNNKGKWVEAAGVEPASENASG